MAGNQIDEVTALKSELTKTKCLLFVAVRNTTVLPRGLLFGKDEREISRMTLATIEEMDNADCFTCYIQPFPYKPLGGMPSDVVIEYDGKTAWVEFLTVFGKLRYAFKQPDANFPDMEKIYADNRKAQDRTNYGNGYYIAQACKALGRLTDKQHTTAIHTPNEKTIAFILSAKSNAITNEQLILPIRVTREDD